MYTIGPVGYGPLIVGCVLDRRVVCMHRVGAVLLLVLMLVLMC